MIKLIIKGVHGKGYHCICVCDYCGNEFKRDYSTTIKQKHHFCNAKCMGKYKSENYSGANASFYGKHHPEEIKRKISKSKKGKKLSETTKRKMSESHANVKSENNPRWKGGRVKIAEGYILIHKPEHPNSRKGGYILEHRYLMEQKIGRYLKREEIVHHINGILDDNGIENLLLLPNAGVHHNLHKDTITGKFIKL